MDMKQFSLPVSMLRQYCFCPRICYFYLIRQLKPQSPIWTQQGLDEHQRQEMLLSRRNLTKYGIRSEGKISIQYNLELQSEELFMHGICDAVLKADDTVSILEFKNTNSVINNIAFHIQLAAYAMLYEEMYSLKIKKGYILYGIKAKTLELNIDEAIKNKVIKIRDSIFALLEQGAMPSTSATANKCCQCEFFNFCSDRF